MKTIAHCMIILSMFLNEKAPNSHSMTKVKVDSIINKSAMQLMDDSSMVGLSIGLYFNGDEFFQNFGSIEKGKKISPTKNTVYEIGSITKTFSGILLANAVLENKIDLNDDILAYLNNKYDNLRYNEIPIRIINLANHSSGLPEDIIPQEFYSLEKPTMYDIINVYEGDRGQIFLRDLHHIKIDKNPGENILYSNVGMILLGIILENIYNTTYSELVNTYFVLPLNMKNTETVYFTSGTDNYTRGYDKNGNIMPHITFQIAGAAGGIKSCTADLIKYIRANINSGDEAMKLSHKTTISKNEQKIGLGWQINSDFCGAKLLWHDGGEPGFSGYIAIIPEYDIGMICLTNQRGRQSQLENLSKSIIKDVIKN